MEAAWPQGLSGRKPSRAARAITVVVIVLQTTALLAASYFFEQGQVKGGLAPETLLLLAIWIVGFPVLGLLGIAWSVLSGLRHWETRRVAIAVLATSIVTSSAIIPALVSKCIGAAMRPIVKRELGRTWRQSEVDLHKEMKAHYDSLLVHLREPRRVLEVRPGRLLLDDRLVVELIHFREFGSWQPSTIIGKEVRVILPNRATFEERYIPGMVRGFSGSSPRDPATRTPYGTVRAFVLFEGELLNKRFSGDPELEEAYFREHATNPY